MLTLLTSMALALASVCPPQTLPATVRGITVVHMMDPGAKGPEPRGVRGYGTAASAATLDSVAAAGLNTVALVAVGRMHSAQDVVVRPDLDVPGLATHAALERMVVQAHTRGLSVVLVPHLQVDDGTWRGQLNPKDPVAAAAFFQSYTTWLRRLAQLAQKHCVAAMSVGVELKALTADPRHAKALQRLVTSVGSAFGGVLTYSANWDEMDRVPLWPALDVVGVNAFWPLQRGPGATDAELEAGAAVVARAVAGVAQRTGKRVLFMEFGFKSVADAALRPWEHPNEVDLDKLPLDTAFQARCYRALLCAVATEPAWAGGIAWFAPSDPHDVDSAARWEGPNGFNPMGKPAWKVLTHGCVAKAP